MSPPVVLLMGPVSAGKSSVAQAFQKIAPEPWLFWEADRCQPPLPTDRFGALATLDTERAMRQANLRAAAAYAEAGFNLIAELYVGDRAATGSVFGDRAFTVVVLCERATVEQRTRARGDRSLEYALANYDHFGWDSVPADLQLRSDGRSADELASELLTHILT